MSATVQEVEVTAKAKRRRFSAQDALGFSANFFRWYNNEHTTPASGCSPQLTCISAAPNSVTEIAPSCSTPRTEPRAHPERFVLGNPVPPPLPTAAWINKPKSVDGGVISRA